MAEGPDKPLGISQYNAADTVAPHGLAFGPGGTGNPVDARAGVAILVAEVQAIRWRDDGFSPTAAIGMLLPVNTPFVYMGDLDKFQFINAVAGAILNVAYYRSWQG